MAIVDQLDTSLVDRPPVQRGRSGWLGSIELLAVVMLAAVLGRAYLAGLFDTPRLQTLLAVFISIVVQAMPFLILGTVLSAAITAFVPSRVFTSVLPRNPALAVPVAGAVGAVLPGCECGSVPVAGALVRRGVPPAAALAFLLSSPAINPVVLVSTAVAFPSRPAMVLARASAGLLAASVMGWLWLRLGRPDWFVPVRQPFPEELGRWAVFWSSCRHDVVHAGGFLVVGAGCAAGLAVTVPPAWLASVAAVPPLAVIALAGLAVLLSICSEADAFVAASLSQFSLTARLAFLTVGPMVDLKLFAMQIGQFGPKFAVRFAPTTFVVAILSAVAVGAVLL
jgi:uncharacterized protein